MNEKSKYSIDQETKQGWEKNNDSKSIERNSSRTETSENIIQI